MTKLLRDRINNRKREQKILREERARKIFADIFTDGKDILRSENFKISGNNTQHGTMSVKDHSINVAQYSLLLSDKFRIKCKQDEMVRGALLHDYFLYDWHNKGHERKRLHGFYHPGIALKNASKEYILTPREKDIIRKHMWPLTVTPPMCREAWLVTAADKYCSLLETVHIQKGHRRG